MSDHFESDLTQGGQPEPPTSPELSTARRRRLAQLAAVAALAIAAIVAIATAPGTSNHSHSKDGGPPLPETERGVVSLLAGIPQSSNTLGRPTAPVTLMWFGDLECPYCKEFALGALPSLIDRWVRGGQLKIEYLSLETATREPKAFKAQETAALAAGMQNRMWNFIETFLHEQGEEGSGYVTEGYLRDIARQIPGINETLWIEDRHDPTLVARVAAGMRLARRAGLNSTPAFLIGRHGGRVARLTPGSLRSPKEFNLAIEYLLDAGKPAHLQYVLDRRSRAGGGLLALGSPLAQETLEFAGEDVA